MSYIVESYVTNMQFQFLKFFIRSKLLLSLSCILLFTSFISITSSPYSNNVFAQTTGKQGEDDTILDSILNQNQLDEQTKEQLLSSPSVQRQMSEGAIVDEGQGGNDTTLDQILNQNSKDKATKQLLPIFKNAKLDIVNQGPIGYSSTVLLNDGSEIHGSLDIIPNVEYTPTSNDLGSAKTSGKQIYNINSEHQITNTGFSFTISYFMPYSALQDDEMVKQLEEFQSSSSPKLPPSFHPSPSIVPSSSHLSSSFHSFTPSSNIPVALTTVIGGSITEKGPDIIPVAQMSLKTIKGIYIKLEATFNAVDTLGDFFSTIGYGVDWSKRIQEIEDIKKCLKNPGIKTFDMNEIKQREQAIEDAKIEVAASMVLKGLVLLMQATLSPLDSKTATAALDPKKEFIGTVLGGKINSGVKILDAVVYTGIDTVGSEAGDAFDKNMNDYINQAKKVVGKCSERYKGIFTFGGVHLEETDSHHGEFSFIIKKDRTIVGSGDAIVDVVGNLGSGDVKERFTVEGNYDPQTNKATIVFLNFASEGSNNPHMLDPTPHIGTGPITIRTQEEFNRAHDEIWNSLEGYGVTYKKQFVVDVNGVPTRATAKLVDNWNVEYEISVKPEQCGPGMQPDSEGKCKSTKPLQGSNP